MLTFRFTACTTIKTHGIIDDEAYEKLIDSLYRLQYVHDIETDEDMLWVKIDPNTDDEQEALIRIRATRTSIERLYLEARNDA